MDENRITEQLIGAAIEVHRNLGPGLLEAAYRQCLAHEFDLRGIPFAREVAIGLDYKGLVIESAYRADFLVARKVIVELKSVETLTTLHRAQLLTFLKWSGLKLGLLLNFNVPTLRSGIRRVVNAM
jgi:GxxExxY protein